MQAKEAIPEMIRDALRAVGDAAAGLTRFQTAVIIALVVLLGAGAVLSYVRSRPRPVEIKQEVVDSEKEGGRSLTVHVAGAVAQPGLYRVKEGARVADALSQAGGPSEDALLDDLNLASRVKDGQKVLVPRAKPCAPGRACDGATPEAAAESGLVNVNTAVVAELEKLPGIGPSLAQRIIDYRSKNGPFSSVEEIDNVEGIGPGKLEGLEGLVTI